MQLDTIFSFNSIIWISSFPSEEAGIVRRMIESMETLSTEKEFGFQQIHVKSTLELEDLLNELTHHAMERGMKPLLHFDMHGNETEGLYIEEEKAFVSWNNLAEMLRELNAATGNNLCIVGAACYGLRAIMPIQLSEPTPFFILLAPEHEVSLGFLEQNIPAFYRSVMEADGIDSPFENHLSSKFKYFHCEKMLFIVIGKYISQQCRGKGKQARIERFLTELFLDGKPKTNQNLRESRKLLKKGIKPDQRLVQRYADSFLIGRQSSFNVNDILHVLDNET